jgi:sugar lactone lactonase YvrE
MRRACVLMVPLVSLAACAREAPPPPMPERVAVAEGFATPESVLWDADQQVWFVSNINGSPTEKADNGFLSRLTRDGAVETLQWVAGGRDGVTLHAPKGMALVGDTLWVTDIDAVRGFDRRTGAPVAAIEFGAEAVFLNDMTVGPDGALYVSDTGIRFGAEGPEHPGPDRVFRVTGREVTVLAEGDHLAWPNGIVWDAANDRFVLVPFGGTTLLGLGTDGATTPIGEGPGQQDGVVILNDGRILVSSWADSSVFAVGPGGSTPVVTGVESPADLGLDPARSLVAIPLFMQNRVEFWRVP